MKWAIACGRTGGPAIPPNYAGTRVHGSEVRLSHLVYNLDESVGCSNSPTRDDAYKWLQQRLKGMQGRMEGREDVREGGVEGGEAGSECGWPV